jgi:hypothetical protein
MRLPTPIWCRRSISAGPITDAAIQQFRLKYSPGFMVSSERNTAGPNFLVAWSPSHLASIRVMMSGTHQAPFSAMTYFSAGCRSNTPPRISAHSGRAAHQ